jgi:polyphenol oxidase
VSKPPYEKGNLAAHVGDDIDDVNANRLALQNQIGIKPVTWLSQVHGIDVIDLDQTPVAAAPVADAVFSRKADHVCAVLTADCLPVLFCDFAGTAVAAAHAGWRGLADGVLEATVQKMQIDASSILAYIGPGIGPDHFEVNDDVRDVFVTLDAKADKHFVRNPHQRWLGNLAAIAEDRLRAVGLSQITQSRLCTASDLARFYSHRAEKGTTGRFASLIWMQGT